MMKTGEQHTRSLIDGRQVYLGGKLIDDVTCHPAFRNIVATVAELYDFQVEKNHKRCGMMMKG